MTEDDLSHEDYLAMRRQQAVSIAEDVIAGRVSLLEGVFTIIPPLIELKLDLDPEWSILTGGLLLRPITCRSGNPASIGAKTLSR